MFFSFLDESKDTADPFMEALNSATGSNRVVRNPPRPISNPSTTANNINNKFQLNFDQKKTKQINVSDPQNIINKTESIKNKNNVRLVIIIEHKMYLVYWLLTKLIALNHISKRCSLFINNFMPAKSILY